MIDLGAYDLMGNLVNQCLDASKQRRGVPEGSMLKPRQDVATRFNSTGLSVERNNVLEHDMAAIFNDEIQRDCDKARANTPLHQLTTQHQCTR